MVKWKQILKKPFCITLCSALVITSGNFTIPGMAGTVKASAEETEGQNRNLIDNPSFEGVEVNDDGSKNIYWWYGSGDAKLDIVEDGKGKNGKYVKVSNRTQNWEAAAQNIFHNDWIQPQDIENHTEYELSCWVKLDEECSSESKMKADLAIKYTDSETDVYGSAWGIADNEVTASKDEWRQIKGSFTTNWEDGKSLKELQFSISEENTNSFYVDDVSLVKKEKTEEPGGDAPLESSNILANPSFNDLNDDGVISWWYGDGTDGSQDDGKGHDGKYVKISKESTQATLAENIPDIKNKIENNTEYEFAFWVKADGNSQDVKAKAELTVEKNGEYPSASESGWTFNTDEVTVSDEWQKVTGNFTTNFTLDNEGKPDFDGLHFKITGTGQNAVSFYADDASITKKKATGDNPGEEPGGNIPAKGTNILDNPSFDGNTEGWFATTAKEAAKLEYIPDGGQDGTGGCVKVYGRDENWNSLAQDIKAKVKNKTKYYFSCWVKLSDEYNAESIVKAGLTIQSTEDNKGEPVYNG